MKNGRKRSRCVKDVDVAEPEPVVDGVALVDAARRFGLSFETSKGTIGIFSAEHGKSDMFVSIGFGVHAAKMKKEFDTRELAGAFMTEKKK